MFDPERRRGRPDRDRFDGRRNLANDIDPEDAEAIRILSLDARAALAELDESLERVAYGFVSDGDWWRQPPGQDDTE